MSAKREMPNMFGTETARPPRLTRPDSKFSHYVPSAEPAPSDALEEPAAESPVLPVEPKQTTVATVRPARKTERLVSKTLELTEDDIWSVFDIPHIDLVIPVFDSMELLLDGPLVQTPLHVLPSMEQTFRRLKASVRTSGRKVSLQTLYAHALAFAYVNSEEWLYLAPSDGRREGSHSRLTSVNTRITPELPEPLVEATHALVAKASMYSSRNAPALEGIKTAALAWSLGRYGEWLDDAVAKPVKAGERVN